MTRSTIPPKRTCRVIKVGGSLFDYEGFVPAFREWHDAQTPAIDILLAGGGRLVDAVRDLDERFAIEARSTHWLCVRLMDITARILHLLLPEAQFADRFERLRRLRQSAEPLMVIFSAEEFLQRYERNVEGTPLPTNWSSTSDSIAARLAQAIHASELVLLKSTSLPPGADRLAAATAGVVDEFFATAASSLAQVRCVNLLSGDESVLGQ